MTDVEKFNDFLDKERTAGGPNFHLSILRGMVSFCIMNFISSSVT